MSLAADAIAALDRALRIAGTETLTLRRFAGANQVAFAVDCHAAVRGYRPDELVGDVIQQDREVILSPTEIARVGWPGPNGSATPTNEDRRVPRKGDQVVIGGRPHTVQAATGLTIAGELVRIEMRVRG